MSTKNFHAGAGYRAAVHNPKPQPATQADYERLQAALTLLTNGYKYSTEVVTIARTALGMSAIQADRLALERSALAKAGSAAQS
ncbi:MAG: hypothetical protein M3N97_04895 [Pseudomonadota bacterium]|nr:hypothetical protein [Pseudomonadota bacterium]